MALIMAFEAADGTTHPNAHWRTAQINIGASDRLIELCYYAYRDQAAFDAGKAPLPGGVHRYTITGQEFLAIASQAPQGETLYAVLAHAADSYALAKLDTPTGEFDEAGDPVLVSFFDGATLV